jgi:hypothetical protein
VGMVEALRENGSGGKYQHGGEPSHGQFLI